MKKPIALLLVLQISSNAVFAQENFEVVRRAATSASSSQTETIDPVIAAQQERLDQIMANIPASTRGEISDQNALLLEMEQELTKAIANQKNKLFIHQGAKYVAQASLGGLVVAVIANYVAGQIVGYRVGFRSAEFNEAYKNSKLGKWSERGIIASGASWALIVALVGMSGLPNDIQMNRTQITELRDMVRAARTEMHMNTAAEAMMDGGEELLNQEIQK